MGDRAGQQKVAHLRGELPGDILLRLHRGGAEMRGAHDAVHPEQHIAAGRLLGKDIQPRSGDMARVQGRLQIFLDDEGAAGTVDDAHSLFAPAEKFRIHHVARFRRQRRVQGDEIRPRLQLLQRHFGHSQLGRPLGREKRVRGDHVHPQAEGAVSDDGSDVSAADDPERLAGQLDPHETRFLPAAGVGGCVGRGQLARQREHHGDRVFRRGDRIPERGIHHHDAPGGGGRHVDVVHPDAGPADDFQPGSAVEQARIDPGARADGDALVVADDRLELRRAQARLQVGVDAALDEYLHRPRRQVLSNEHAWFHAALFSVVQTA